MLLKQVSLSLLEFIAPGDPLVRADASSCSAFALCRHDLPGHGPHVCPGGSVSHSTHSASGDAVGSRADLHPTTSSSAQSRVGEHRMMSAGADSSFQRSVELCEETDRAVWHFKPQTRCLLFCNSCLGCPIERAKLVPWGFPLASAACGVVWL